MSGHRQKRDKSGTRGRARRHCRGGAMAGHQLLLRSLLLLATFATLLAAAFMPQNLQNLYPQQSQHNPMGPAGTLQGLPPIQPAASAAPPQLPVTYLNHVDELQRAALAQQQQTQAQWASQLLAPVQLRPNFTVNIRDFSKRISDDIRLVSERTSCVRKIGQFFESDGKFQALDAVKLRESILNQTNALLAQHKAAVGAIVQEAERAAMAHQFVKNLTVNYTDVHRVRNELEAPTASSYNSYYFFNNNNLQEYPNDYTTNQYGPSSSSGTGDKPQFTSISGGTPVPGPVEWQTPVRSIVMRVNENFGDIPVNTSMSAVHLPLPIYPGLPEIMNGIAWSERLDTVFRRNLQQFMHVHHQYYGDTLGFMRTFPAHKWRIPRNEPDLFDARTRPWYIAGAATPKDVVILVDSSGSMTGLRREIAKGVVFEILDTLTINDHFSVLRFSETVTPVGLPKCGLRRPRLAGQLRAECAGFRSSAAAATAAAAAAAAGGGGGQQHYQQQHLGECAAWRRQWDGRGQYLRDNPSLVTGKNATYMTDDEFNQSIANVTLDIRDAYLLPATSRNVRYLKSNFSMPTAGIANFTRALMAGFELLQAYNRTSDQGSQCNKAIMLITDGSQFSHMEVFNRYNYPGAPVRMFTYMIGREVGDIRPLKRMACENRGYYTHVINLSEVREQVQKYLPVMARPLVLAQQRPITWTNAYGDETHQVLTDWALELKRRERARLMLNEERERLNEANSSDVINIELTEIAEYEELPQVDELLKDRIICEDSSDQQHELANMSSDAIASLESEIDPLGYNDFACHWSTRRADLLTSVVKPVFDLRNTSIFFERVLSKNVWQEREIRLRNAQLLGVASVDLRVADIIRAAPSHLLGPNGYSVLLGQNGFIMHHPNYYALLEDPFDRHSKILKPYFSSVDLSHLEQVFVKNESDPIKRRNEEMKLLKLREAALNRSTGSETITIKRTIDCRKRPYVRSQTFHYGPIRDTPYAFMIALPESYGANRYTAKLALDQNSFSYLQPSDYDLWTVHPDYRYCEKVSSSSNSGGNSGSDANQATSGKAPGAPHLHLNDSLSTLIELLNSTALGESYELDYDDLSTISGSSNTNDQLKASYRQRFAQATSGADGGRRQQQQLQRQPARYICDKELLGSLLFDAKATYESFVSTSNARASDDGSCAQTSDEMRTKLAQLYGLEMSFVATRSGLTRTLVFDRSPRIKMLAKLFIERHDRALDEAWYQRTVDWNLRFDAEATIIAVPFNAHVRLIAKLRQRITQRHPAANDTRTNCDIPPEEAEGGGGDEEAAPASAENASESQAAVATVESSSGVVEILAGQRVRRQDQPAPEPAQAAEQPGGGGGGDQTPPAEAPPAPPTSDQSGAAAASSGEQQQQQQQQPAKINYNDYSSFDFLDLLANSSVHIVATQSVVVNKARKQQRAATAVTGHLYDYATFARKFLNSTSLVIEPLDNSGGEQSETTASAGGGGAGAGGTPQKVEICADGGCATRCGLRNDTIDCLLVDNNGYIVVAEELAHIGRSLQDYDDKLMLSLVNRRVFHQIVVTDYQAICQAVPPEATRPAGSAQGPLGAASASLLSTVSAAASAASTSASSASSSSPSPSSLTMLGLKQPFSSLGLAQSVLANFASALVWTSSTLYSALLLRSVTPDELFAGESLLGRLHQWQRSAILAQAQSATANQSLLALLPNKTYLRPCEKPVVLYETRPSVSDPNKLAAHNERPEFYLSRCNCSAWFVYDFVPRTNLLMLIVNTTAACRRCDTPPLVTPATPSVSLNLAPPLTDPLNSIPIGPNSLLAAQTQPVWTGKSAAEEQVCSMLERDSQLYVQKPTSCLAQHPEEAHIHICGAGARPHPWRGPLLALASLAAMSLLLQPAPLVALR